MRDRGLDTLLKSGLMALELHSTSHPEQLYAFSAQRRAYTDQIPPHAALGFFHVLNTKHMASHSAFETKAVLRARKAAYSSHPPSHPFIALPSTAVSSQTVGTRR